MILELLHVMRRWPAVGAAVMSHFAFVGILLMLPEPPPPPEVEGMPPTITSFPRPPRPGGGAGAPGRRPERPPRDPKRIVKPAPPQEVPVERPHEVVAEPAPVDATVADAAEGEGLIPGAVTGDGTGQGTGHGPGGPGGGDGVGVGDSGLPGGTAPEWPSSQPRPIDVEIDPPDLLSRVEPEYPMAAIRTRKQGVVVLACIIDTEGHVEVINVKESVGLLDKAAMKAVRQWRYRPATLNGRPQAVYLDVTVTFSLR